MGKAGEQIHQRIEDRLDILQNFMEEGKHLTEENLVKEALANLGKYRSYMNDEQSDYVDGCRFALDEQMEWK